MKIHGSKKVKNLPRHKGGLILEKEDVSGITKKNYTPKASICRRIPCEQDNNRKKRRLN